MDKYFRTHNFYLAAFLFTQGMVLANVDRITDRSKAAFVFIDSPKREELAHHFNYSEEGDEVAMVDARKLIYSIRSLKEKLYQNN